MNELIERVQYQLDNNHAVSAEDIKKMLALLKGKSIEIGNNIYFLDIKPPINKPES